MTSKSGTENSEFMRQEVTQTDFLKNSIELDHDFSQLESLTIFKPESHDDFIDRLCSRIQDYFGSHPLLQNEPEIDLNSPNLDDSPSDGKLNYEYFAELIKNSIMEDLKVKKVKIKLSDLIQFKTKNEEAKTENQNILQQEGQVQYDMISNDQIKLQNQLKKGHVA